ncbi:MAG: Mth938-like domain-containing protein [Nitrosomonadales bacterium]|nr:Mth938-like domain-containing protein [Nitrosomonadales bacterium]
MKLYLADPGDTKLFTAHGDDHVMVNGERFGSSVVVLADAVHSDWEARSFDDLDEAHFACLLAYDPDVVLLGTGARQRFPHPRLYRALTDARIGVECMDTPAACRTYNILVAEGRRVVAAILI